MKKINNIILALAALLLVSCADDSLSPILTFDKAGKGAYVRLIEDGVKLINLFDIPGSEYVYSVDFVDEEAGATVSEYRLEVTYIDNFPDNGTNSLPAQVFRTFSTSDFSPSVNGNPGIANISVSANDILSATGLSADDLGPGDIFRFKGYVVTPTSTFGKDNSDADVNGSAFQGHFDFDLTASCPSELAGMVAFTNLETWCQGDPGSSGMVEIIATGGGSYTFSDWSLGAYDPCYGGAGTSWGTLAFKDVCAEVSFSGFTDNYGDTWTFTSSLEGNVWTIGWVNTYGEAGVSEVYFPGGGDWPFTLK